MTGDVMHQRSIAALVGLFALWLLTVGHAFAQRTDSGDRKVENVVATALSEIGLPGRVSAQRVTMAPGAVRGDHSHEGRMALQVILEGIVTEYRGDQTFIRSAGEVVTIPAGSTHSAENKGTAPAIYVEINIFPQ
jgi:quercetin dioxygenase-like cupin family protein